jgi:sugar lactone lactonase YvrE
MNESKVREHIAIVPDAHLHAAHTFRFNDGKVDPCGRLWAGTMATDALENPDASKLGRLYCVQRATTPSKHTDLAATYEIVEKLGDIGISNGLEWSGGHMYYIDSLKLVRTWKILQPTQPHTFECKNALSLLLSMHISSSELHHQYLKMYVCMYVWVGGVGLICSGVLGV